MTTDVARILDHLERVAVQAGARSAEIEAARSLPRDLAEAMVGGGIFRLTVPVEHGGLGVDPLTLLPDLERAATNDGSAAWCAADGLLAGLDAPHLPIHHAETIFADSRAVVAVDRRRSGSGRRTDDGGLLVSGRWSWVAGATHCTWLGGGVDIAPSGDDGEPSGVVAYFRRDQVIVLDTWHPLGLRGAGATDYEVTEAFVPEGRWAGLPPRPEPGRRRSWSDAAGPVMAALALGLAQRAVSESTISEALPHASAAAARSPSTRRELARLADRVAAGRHHLRHLARQAVERSSAGDGAVGHDSATEGSAAGSPSLAVAAAEVVDQAVDVVTRCFRLSGPGAVLHASPLQRLLRDVHTLAHHPALVDDPA